MTTERDEVEALAGELFRAVEGPQGLFHLSDGETFATKAEFFARIRGRLSQGKTAVARMRIFLRKHGELQPRPPQRGG